MRTAHMLRSDITKEKLLDAAEALIGDAGFRSASHRSLAARAGVHTALVNYHFGSKDLLFEEVVARRAARLQTEFAEALAALRSRSGLLVEEVLRAYWQPFAALEDSVEDPAWRRYLCVFARLHDRPDGDAWRRRHFGGVDERFLVALRQALPEAPREALVAGYRYCILLFDAALLDRCVGACETRSGHSTPDIAGLIAFLAAGMRHLAGHSASVIALGAPPAARLAR